MKTKISSLVLCLFAAVLFTTGCGSSNDEILEPIDDSAIRVILDRTNVDPGNEFYNAPRYEIRVLDQAGDDVLPIFEQAADYDVNNRMTVNLVGVPATASSGSSYDVVVSALSRDVIIDEEVEDLDGFFVIATRFAGPVTTLRGQTVDVGDGTAFPFNDVQPLPINN